VHRSGAKRPATFGGFYLGRSQEERELRDLMRRLDVAQEMRTAQNGCARIAPV